ncbi:hypothetical protein BDP27DRAFT_1080403 [Rhodocollybia butyracea]|uniref:Biotin synthase n=1 Tax=Rhodocollybia butyracea TaxID=206335 RepID=A0A9P5P4H9_9AGAR|nr:hypothetical protein BDP27DRAFT_1080403 [Rhodocollybia butyracea]
MFRSLAAQKSLPVRRYLATHASIPSASTAITRHDWTRHEIQDLKFQSPNKIQLCTLMNIKTGGCTEDCSYCSQSSRYSTPTKASTITGD